MLKRLRHWRENRRLAALGWPHPAWENAIADWAVAQRYQGAQRRLLHDTAMRFLMRKHIAPGGNMVLDDFMRLRIATMAVVPVLGLDLDWYGDWSSIIVYDQPFVPPHVTEDEYGIVHLDRHPLGGEAWSDGPVILSWQEVERAGHQPGYNVVIHELAHKLDMRHDGPNGAPPLHRDIDPVAWHRDFSTAWEELESAVEADSDPPIDPYALEDPGEFFAVASEVFFETPRHLQRTWPAVYAHLAAFYRQDPAEGPSGR